LENGRSGHIPDHQRVFVTFDRILTGQALKKFRFLKVDPSLDVGTKSLIERDRLLDFVASWAGFGHQKTAQFDLGSPNLRTLEKCESHANWTFSSDKWLKGFHRT
jgi:hypothetical protein